MCIADISTVVILHYPSATHEPSSATGPVSHHLLTPVFCHTSDWDYIPVLHHLIQMQEFTNNSVPSQHKRKYPKYPPPVEFHSKGTTLGI